MKNKSLLERLSATLRRGTAFWLSLLLISTILPLGAVAESSLPEPASDIFRLYPASTRYFWNQLTEHEKELFAIVYDGICGYHSRINLPKKAYTAAEVDRVCFTLQEDCPELIQLKTCWYDSSGGYARSVSVSYYYDQQWGSQRMGVMVDRINTLLEPCEGLDDFQRELLIYKHIIAITEYSLENWDRQTADCVFVDGLSVCAGYSEAFTLACRMAGIPCFIVSGYAYVPTGEEVIRERTQENSHAWNAVEIGGQWYFADPTWDDPLPVEGQEIPVFRSEYVMYFNIDEHELWKTHELDYGAYSGWTLPSFQSMEDNFFERTLPNSWVKGDWRDELQAQMDAVENQPNPRIVLIFSSVEERNQCRSAVSKEVRTGLKQRGWGGYAESMTLFDYPILVYDMGKMRKPAR